MKINSKIFVAGHLGLVGSAITKKLIEDVINLIKYNALDLWEFSSVFYKSALEGG